MKVLIIGGGIGGLTTALALKKHSIDYQVFEAAPEIKEVGAGIWVPANAMNVLDRLGVGDKVKSEGKLLDKISVGDQRGKVWQTIHGSQVMKEFGNGTTAIFRGRLQSALYSELDTQKVETGKRLTSLEQHKDLVTAFFEDGTSATGDALIGADGIHSAVRNHLFGPCELRYSGQTCWRSVVPFQLPEKHRDGMIEMWGSLRGQRFAYSQVSPNEVYFYATLYAPAGGKDDAGKTKLYLKNLYASYGQLVQDILESAAGEKIIRTDLFDLKPIKNWVSGRVALMGDAAHATTPNLGQGGAQAIEDGYVIAKCLSENTDVGKALNRYQAIRYQKATYIVNTSWSYGQLSNLNNPLAVFLRNLVMRNTPQFIGKAQMKKVYSLNF